MNKKEILIKYNKNISKEFKIQRFKFKYIKKYNIILLFTYPDIWTNKYNNVILLDNQKKAFYLKDNDLVELSKNKLCFILDNIKNKNINSFKKLFNSDFYMTKNTINLFDNVKYYYSIDEGEGEIQDWLFNKEIEAKLKKYNIKDFNLKTQCNKINKKVEFFNIKTKIDYIQDDLFVIRIFSLFNRRNKEIYRIYINNNGIYKYQINNLNQWVYSTNPLDNYMGVTIDLEKIDFDIKKTCLSYYINILKDKSLKKEMNLCFLLEMINCPIIEQLYKIGLSNLIINNQLNICENGSKYFIEYYFKEFNYEGNNIYDNLCVNKQQFNKIKSDIVSVKNNNKIKTYTYTLSILNKFTKKSLSSLDYKTFCLQYNIFETLFNQCPHFDIDNIYDFIEEIIDILQKSNTLPNTIISIFNQLLDINKKYKNIYKLITIYLEYLYIYDKVLDRFNVDLPLKFKNFNEINDMQKYANDIYYSLKSKKKNKKFKKAVKSLKKYNYSNEEFSITYPESEQDLLKEGYNLHHCVEEFGKAIRKKQTNILFLRKKDNIDKPFFTIELSNKGKIKQVHGFDNCDIDKSSNEYKFLKKWSKKYNFKIGKIDNLFAP